jgi:hypothetical protein
MSATVVVPGRFNGPLESGNGGYSAGALAAWVDGHAEVSLRRPVPLDRPLDVVRDGDGGTVRALDGEDLVAEAAPIEPLVLDVPEPVGVAEARRAAERYRGLEDGLFSRCFVCGRARPDAFGVFAGQVEGREVVASPWIPPEWTAGDGGNVRAEFVWAVLDCPTFFALHLDRDLSLSVLARLAVRIDAPVTAGEEHVVMAWPIGRDGRKLHAGGAVLSAGGDVLAAARALLIEPRAG